MSRRSERRMRKLEQELIGGEENLVRRLHEFIKNNSLVQEQAIMLCDLVTQFYERGVKNPELGEQALKIGKAPYAPELTMIHLLGNEKQKCTSYFARYYGEKS